MTLACDDAAFGQSLTLHASLGSRSGSHYYDAASSRKEMEFLDALQSQTCSLLLLGSCGCSSWKQVKRTK